MNRLSGSGFGKTVAEARNDAATHIKQVVGSFDPTGVIWGKAEVDVELTDDSGIVETSYLTRVNIVKQEFVYVW